MNSIVWDSCGHSRFIVRYNGQVLGLARPTGNIDTAACTWRLKCFSDDYTYTTVRKYKYSESPREEIEAFIHLRQRYR